MASFEQIYSNENRSEYAPLKAGQYHVEIIEGNVKPTSQPGGTYVEFKFRVCEGEYVGRVLTDRFNIVNPSSEAARIGKQQLIGLADAVGIINPNDTDPFIGKHVIANVVIRPASGQYGESNGIKSYRKFEGQYTPSAPAQASASTPQNAPSASVARPSWLKK